MLDSDLAELYGVSVKRLNEQFKRNMARFPDDFAFQLGTVEANSLRSQFATLDDAESGRGRHRKYLPYVFTEQGVAMLASILRSQRAIDVNIAIVRTFVKLRQVLATHQDLARKVEQHDRDIRALMQAVQRLLAEPQPKKNPIGFARRRERD